MLEGYPPRTEAELVERARKLAHYTVGELADSLGLRAPIDLERDKGWVGQLLEWALAATASNRAVPDFLGLDVEMKTVPVEPSGAPRESTFITSVSFADLLEGDWESSTLRHKTRRVLWIPIEADEELPLSARRIGQAVLWSPSPAQEAGLRKDWELLQTTARRGLENLHAKLGVHLQVRPKARNARVRTEVILSDGRRVDYPPQGFYFRRTFTREVFRQHYTLDG